MTTDTAQSRRGVMIRLTQERWAHIIEEHAELTALRNDVLLTISVAERVLLGGDGECLAVREIEPAKWMVVVYREYDEDGFIITAFMTRRQRSLDRRMQLWP